MMDPVFAVFIIAVTLSVAIFGTVSLCMHRAAVWRALQRLYVHVRWRKLPEDHEKLRKAMSPIAYVVYMSLRNDPEKWSETSDTLRHTNGTEVYIDGRLSRLQVTSVCKRQFSTVEQVLINKAIGQMQETRLMKAFLFRDLT